MQRDCLFALEIAELLLSSLSSLLMMRLALGESTFRTKESHQRVKGILSHNQTFSQLARFSFLLCQSVSKTRRRD